MKDTRQEFGRMLVQAVSRFSVLCCVSVGGIVCAPP